MKNNSTWMKIAGAACLEVAWVTGLKHASAPWEWIITELALVISFYTIFVASSRLPVGTVYSVFVGLGTAGTVLVDMLWFGEPFKLTKLVLILVLLTGVIGLKLITGDSRMKEVS
ncbi:DMT family transporter [Paenibacillus sp. HW567]|uniref:DMT family transporter n=1 Tax=Paenibacillus sp. HW567 TaxID=1034769 RepID=UPI00037739DA|nr:multidrug efflux SMR transporter [Paenibacillus sp. HW567]